MSRLKRSGLARVDIEKHPEAARKMVEVSGAVPPARIEHLLSVNITATKFGFRTYQTGASASSLAASGFVGYEYLSAIHQSGRSLLIRVSSNVRLLKKLGYFKESGNTVYLWPDHAASKKLPPLVLRLVVANNGKHPVYLVTNVLSQKRLTNAQVITIYSKRWGSEMSHPDYPSSYSLYRGNWAA